MTDWIDIYSGRKKPEELNREKFDELTAAADKGDAVSQFRLGCCYQNGWIRKKDLKAAYELWIKAVNAGHKLGNCYAFGWHVKRDYKAGIERWTQAAADGVPSSMHNIGWAYFYGNGAKQDYGKAVEWYEKAADAGLVMSLHMLAYMYESGKGVKKDLQKAGEWYAKAAALGSFEAQDRLAELMFGKRKKVEPIVEAEEKEEEVENE